MKEIFGISWDWSRTVYGVRRGETKERMKREEKMLL